MLWVHVRYKYFHFFRQNLTSTQILTSKEGPLSERINVEPASQTMVRLAIEMLVNSVKQFMADA